MYVGRSYRRKAHLVLFVLESWHLGVEGLRGHGIRVRTRGSDGAKAQNKDEGLGQVVGSE